MQPFLKSLGPELNQKLEKLSVRKNYSANQQIFAENETATFLPIVLKGRVKLIRHPARRKKGNPRVFQTGEGFGISAAVEGQKFSANRLRDEGHELLIPAAFAFLGLMREADDFSALVMSQMCGMLRNRAKVVQILATPSSEHRIAMILLNLALENSENLPVEIRLRRQDIAEMAGLTTETTIRTIGNLADKGLVKIVRRKIVIEDITLLRRFLN